MKSVFNERDENINVENIISFKKYEETISNFNLPKIKTIANRTHFSKIKKNEKTNLAKIENILQKKIKVCNLLNINEISNDETENQIIKHNSLFSSPSIKNKFIQFSNHKIFFDLIDGNESVHFLKIQNTSSITLRVYFILHSKEFFLDETEIVLSPNSSKNMKVKFIPLEKPLFHYSLIDVFVTNEKIKNLNFNEVKKSGHKIDLKERINNCLLGSQK